MPFSFQSEISVHSANSFCVELTKLRYARTNWIVKITSESETVANALFRPLLHLLAGGVDDTEKR